MTDLATPPAAHDDRHEVTRDLGARDTGASVPPPPPGSATGAGGHSGGPTSTQAARGRPSWRRGVAIAAVAAVVGAGTAVPVTLALTDEQPTAATPPVAAAADAPETAPLAPEARGDIEAIAAAVTPSVALVEVRGQQRGGAGSAVVYRDGYLLTNAHVVAGADEVNVTLPDGTRERAEVVGADPRSDIAVLQVGRTDLPAPRFADSAPRVGATAVAIGAPFGLDGSVTAGVVSALDRSVQTPQAPLVGMIQTDAPINPGNSGGALVDAEGRVMGINTAILSPTGGNNGIGFAIPIATARGVADQIIDNGTVAHAFLGVSGTTVDPSISELYGLGVDAGAVITDVGPGTPAADAGLQRGDIVTGIGGQEVTSMADLAGRVAQRQPGDRVELDVTRGGESLTLDATLGEAPAQG